MRNSRRASRVATMHTISIAISLVLPASAVTTDPRDVAFLNDLLKNNPGLAAATGSFTTCAPDVPQGWHAPDEFERLRNARYDTMDALKGQADALMEGDCTVVEDGETIPAPAADGSCFELHVGTGVDSTYTMVTAGVSHIAIYAQYSPLDTRFYDGESRREPIAQRTYHRPDDQVAAYSVEWTSIFAVSEDTFTWSMQAHEDTWDYGEYGESTRSTWMYYGTGNNESTRLVLFPADAPIAHAFAASASYDHNARAHLRAVTGSPWDPATDPCEPGHEWAGVVCAIDGGGDTARLAKLSLAFCNISVLPESIGECDRLNYLDLRHNNLERLPDSLANLRDIFDSADNRVSGGDWGSAGEGCLGFWNGDGAGTCMNFCPGDNIQGDAELTREFANFDDEAALSGVQPLVPRRPDLCPVCQGTNSSPNGFNWATIGFEEWGLYEENLQCAWGIGLSANPWQRGTSHGRVHKAVNCEIGFYNKGTRCI
eukprot:COSAG02_NODE_10518_length_1924_cov_1.465205_1_plen_484_part_10